MTDEYNPQEQLNTPRFGEQNAEPQPGPVPGIAMSLVGAVLGAAVGAGIWLAVGYATGFEIGYIAILVGALAGWGAVLLGKTRSPAVGMIAAVAGLAGVIGGSYANYQVSLRSDSTREAFRSGLMESWHDMNALEFLGEDSAKEAAEAAYKEGRGSGEIPATATLDQYRGEFLQGLQRTKADRFFNQMDKEDRDMIVNSLFETFLASDDASFVNSLKNDGKNTGFLALFAILGLIYGFRVGKGRDG